MLLVRKIRKAHDLLKGLALYTCQNYFRPCFECFCLFCVPLCIFMIGFVIIVAVIVMCVMLSPTPSEYGYYNFTPIAPERICDMILRHSPTDVFDIFQQMTDTGRPVTPEMYEAFTNCSERIIQEEMIAKWRAVDTEVSRPLPFHLPNPPLHGYSVTIAPNAAVCGKLRKEKKVLIYVYTAPDNVRHRQIIRQTWADTRHDVYSHFYYRPYVIFVLGRPAAKFVQDQILFEADIHGDILQHSYIDDYYNLTLKSLAAIEWAYDSCSDVDYFLKIDEDVFLNAFAFLSYLSHRRITTPSLRDEKPTLLCHIHEESHALRSGKYAVSYDEYPRIAYPNFCGGPAYAMNRQALEAIHRRSLTAHFFKLEDVFVTGLLAIAANVTHVDIGKHYIFDGRHLTSHVIDEEWTNFFFSHMGGIWHGDANRWLVVWNYLKRRSLNVGGNYMK